MTDNKLVADKEAVEYSIFNETFGDNGLFHRRMDQCRNSRAELLLVVSGDRDVLPTHLHILELFPPKELMRDVFINQNNKNI